jgi:hypothetical protein
VLDATRTRLDGCAGGAGATDAATAIGDVVRSSALTIDLGRPALEAKARKALQDPEFLFYKLKQKGYKLSFLLVPMSLPWMILLFAGKRGIRIYDHVVFLLYSISFMSMLAILAALLATYTSAPGGVYITLFLIVPVAHMFAQLKEGYAIGWFSAAWRTAALATFALLTLVAYFVIILLLGLLD